jgi:hypothetical protein
LGNCCGSAILAAARSCNFNDPPCVVSAQPVAPTANAPTASAPEFTPDVPPVATAAPGDVPPPVETAAKRFVAVGLYAGASSGIQEAATREAQYGFRFNHLLRFVFSRLYKHAHCSFLRTVAVLIESLTFLLLALIALCSVIACCSANL